MINSKALSVKEIAKTLALPSIDVVRNLIALEQNGLVTVAGIEGIHHKYRRLVSL